MDIRGLVDRVLPGASDADRSTDDGAGPAAEGETTVAIACQGGGSHAAFTAGALGYLLEHLPPTYRCCGISGTSGGAVCAATAWYGLVSDTASPSDLLESVWLDVAATSRWEQWVNSVAVSKVERAASGSGPTVSPYGNPGSEWSKRHLERVLTDHVDFERFPELVDGGDVPALFVGAVDVETGEPRVFADDAVTPDAVLASAAIPSLFEAVAVDDAHYWDGLFGKNPPIREFLTRASVPPVDELWVVQLTPQRAESVPRTAGEIDDRMRQLVGNVSLQQELAFVEAVNDWVRDDRVDAPGLTETTVRTISLHEEQAANSTVDRDADFVRDLLADGRAEAVGFRNAVVDADERAQSM